MTDDGGRRAAHPRLFTRGPDEDGARTARPAVTGGRWRAVLSAVCIAMAAVLVPVTIVAACARTELVDEQSFVDTLAPLADDPAVQAMLVDETMQAIRAQVDLSRITSDGLDRLGLPPAASAALRRLAAPAAGGLETLTTDAVRSLFASDGFADIWTFTTRTAHRALTLAATSDGGGVVMQTDEGVGIQIGAIVERVRTELTERGMAVAVLIPDVDRVVIVSDGQSLTMIRAAYAVAATVGWWLPVLTLGLAVGGLLLARRRATAVLGAGTGVAIGAAILIVGLAIGAASVGPAAASLQLSPAGFEAIYARVTADMMRTAVLLAIIGLLVAVVGWATGHSRPATRLRRSIGVGLAAAGVRLRASPRRHDPGDSPTTDASTAVAAEASVPTTND